MSEPPEPFDRTDFDRRLRAVNERRAAEKAAQERAGQRRDAGWGVALKLSSEFVAAVMVGAAIGYGIDVAAGTSPWGLIAFVGLGFAAAVVNVLRGIGRMEPSPLERHRRGEL